MYVDIKINHFYYTLFLHRPWNYCSTPHIFTCSHTSKWRCSWQVSIREFIHITVIHAHYVSKYKYNGIHHTLYINQSYMNIFYLSKHTLTDIFTLLCTYMCHLLEPSHCLGGEACMFKWTQSYVICSLVLLVGQPLVNMSVVKIQTKHVPSRLQCKWIWRQVISWQSQNQPLQVFF